MKVDILDLLKQKNIQKDVADIMQERIIDFFTYPKIRAILYEQTNHTPILIENKTLKIKIENYEIETKLTISNLNIVAQHGCFMYHDMDDSPLENNLMCTDIHKSLIPYIINKYLKQNNINENSLFPTEDNLVNESTFNMMEKIVVNDVDK